MSFIDIEQFKNFQQFCDFLKTSTCNFLFSSKQLNTLETFWQRSFSLRKKQREKSRIALCIQNHFKDYISNQYRDAEIVEFIQSKWELILEQAIANVNKNNKCAKFCLNIKCVQKLFKALNEVIIDIDSKGCRIENSLRVCFHDISSIKALLKKRSFSYLFCELSDIDKVTLRTEIQTSLQELFVKLSSSNNGQTQFLEMLLGQMITLYAFLGDPKDGDSLQIPQKKNGKWHLFEYQSKNIALSPSWMPSAVHALSLVSKGGPSLLVFKATRGPLSILADFTPMFSVGELLFRLGKNNIKDWIRKTRLLDPTQKIQVFGQSLGASLAYQTALAHPSDVEVHAYTPPGFLRHQLNRENIKGRIYLDPNDIVSMVGKQPEKATMIKIIRERPHNFISAHFRAFGGGPSLLLKANASRENSRIRRLFFSIFHQILALPVSLLMVAILAVGHGLFACKKRRKDKNLI